VPRPLPRNFFSDFCLEIACILETIFRLDSSLFTSVSSVLQKYGRPTFCVPGRPKPGLGAHPEIRDFQDGTVAATLAYDT